MDQPAIVRPGQGVRPAGPAQNRGRSHGLPLRTGSPPGRRHLDRCILIVGIFAAATLIISASFRSRTPEHPPVEAQHEETVVHEAAPGFFTVRDTVRRGDTFSGVLVRNGLSMQDILRVLECNRDRQLFSPRQLRPGNTLTLQRDDLGSLRQLTISVSPEETFIFDARGSAVEGYCKPVHRETRLRKVAGTVAYSVDHAVREAGGDTRLTLKMAEMFEYDIDFFTDVRTGDTFSILVEERFVDGCFAGYGEVLYGSYEGDRIRSAAVWYSPDGADTGGYYEPGGTAKRKLFLRSPLNYRRISSTFSNSRMHPILKVNRPHHGVDYVAPTGTPVVALGDGVVTFSGSRGGYGNLVEIRHGQDRRTRYGHLSRFGKGVRKGVRVSQGQVIGYVGMTGLATGPHLHFEVLDRGAPINPLTMRNVPAEPIPAKSRPAFDDYVDRLLGLDGLLLAGQVLERFDARRLTVEFADATQHAGDGAVR